MAVTVDWLLSDEAMEAIEAMDEKLAAIVATGPYPLAGDGPPVRIVYAADD